jgi:integrase
LVITMGRRAHLPTATGKTLGRNVVLGARRLDYRIAWRTACRKAGVAGTLKHDMRRSAARNLIRAGVPADTVMSYTGHKSRSMLTRYNIIDQEKDHASAAAQLTRYLAGAVSDSSVTIGAFSAPGVEKPGAQVLAIAR